MTLPDLHERFSSEALGAQPGAASQQIDKEPALAALFETLDDACSEELTDVVVKLKLGGAVPGLLRFGGQDGCSLARLHLEDGRVVELGPSSTAVALLNLARAGRALGWQISWPKDGDP